MIRLEERGAVTILRMERGKGNALDLEFGQKLLDTLDQLEKSSTKAVVLTGKDSTFCAGVDLQAMIEGGPEYVRKYVPLMQRCFERFARFPKPVVAAVNGHAIAGGAIIMFVCDQRILTNASARVGLTEVLVGVKFPAWAIEIARFCVPPQHLSRVALTGRTFLPEESLRLGLVDEIVDADLLIDRAVAVAEELAAIDANIFTETKMLVRAPMLEAARKQAATTDAAITDYWASESTLKTVAEFAQKLQAKRK